MALMVAPAAAMGQFQFRDVNSKSIELTEKGSPVFVYNYGTMLKEGTRRTAPAAAISIPSTRPTASW